MRFFERSWGICRIDRLEPRADASVGSVGLAAPSRVSALFAEELPRKSVPLVNEARPRPAASKVTPWMFRVDLPVSLKVSLRLSPFSRLMPLNEESCAVVVICWMTLLYWLTRLARMVCEAASATAAVTVPAVAGVLPLILTPSPVGAVPDVVIVWLAASFVEGKVTLSTVAETGAFIANLFQ